MGEVVVDSSQHFWEIVGNLHRASRAQRSLPKSGAACEGDRRGRIFEDRQHAQIVYPAPELRNVPFDSSYPAAELRNVPFDHPRAPRRSSRLPERLGAMTLVILHKP